MLADSQFVQERKYFDSGDYALSKAGKASEGGVTTVGQMHPQPENIPHLTSPGPGNGSNGSTSGSGPNGSVGGLPGANSGSPVKESSFLQRETSADDPGVISPAKSPEQSGISPPPQKTGVPIRWQQ